MLFDNNFCYLVAMTLNINQFGGVLKQQNPQRESRGFYIIKKY